MTGSGSLCSGVGALDLAVGRVLGVRTAWFAENDPAASLVLAHHFGGVPNLGDITVVDWASVEPVDVLTAGFPCQGLSSAGLRRGFADERSGLWVHVARAVDALRPSLLVVENVRGLLSTPAGEDPDDDEDSVRDLGPDGWGVGDGAAGPVRALGVVLGDLADIGFDATWCCLPASAVGACHARQRVFLVASPADAGGEFVRQQPVAEPWRFGAAIAGDAGPAAAYAAGPGWAGSAAGSGPLAPHPGSPGRGGLWRAGTGLRVDRGGQPTAGRDGDEPAAAHAAGGGRGQAVASNGSGQPDPARRAFPWGLYGPAVRRWERLTRPAPDPVEPGPRGGRDRLAPAFPEWMMGLPDGWVTAVPGVTRNDALRLAGNAVVWQQAVAALSWLLPAHFGAAFCEVPA